MTSRNFIFREIKPEDNEQLATVIKSVILEMGAPKTGTAFEDEATNQMFENFQKLTSFYYVVLHKNKIVGGAGIAKLDNVKGDICELQKMYFLPSIRGKGLGSKLIETCLKRAKLVGFKKCYLETMPYMEAATTLYRKNGFVNLEKPLGNTGHYSCNVWMIKEL